MKKVQIKLENRATFGLFIAHHPKIYLGKTLKKTTGKKKKNLGPNCRKISEYFGKYSTEVKIEENRKNESRSKFEESSDQTIEKKNET